MDTQTQAAAAKQESSKKVLKDFLKTLIVPLVINKFFMMYFGLMYSNYPDEGYGYGFAATIFFLLANCGFFIWKYRDIEDP